MQKSPVAAMDLQGWQEAGPYHVDPAALVRPAGLQKSRAPVRFCLPGHGSQCSEKLTGGAAASSSKGKVTCHKSVFAHRTLGLPRSPLTPAYRLSDLLEATHSYQVVGSFALGSLWVHIPLFPTSRPGRSWLIGDHLPKSQIILSLKQEWRPISK